MNLFATFLFDTHSVMGPVDVQPDMNLLASLADHGKIDIWHFMPVYVNELGQNPIVLEKFRSSKFISAGGGQGWEPFNSINGMPQLRSYLGILVKSNLTHELTHNSNS